MDIAGTFQGTLGSQWELEGSCYVGAEPSASDLGAGVRVNIVTPERFLSPHSVCTDGNSGQLGFSGDLEVPTGTPVLGLPKSQGHWARIQSSALSTLLWPPDPVPEACW